MAVSVRTPSNVEYITRDDVLVLQQCNRSSSNTSVTSSTASIRSSITTSSSSGSTSSSNSSCSVASNNIMSITNVRKLSSLSTRISNTCHTGDGNDFTRSVLHTASVSAFRW